MKKIIQSLFNFKRMVMDKALLISYDKIDQIPDVKAGYVDIDVVAKRYLRSSRNLCSDSLLKQTPVSDNFYFLEQDSKKYFGSISENFSILDVGCGSGSYAKVFKRKNSLFEKAIYYGCEIDKRFVNVCKKIYPEGIFFVSLADKIEKEDNSFDMVYCSSTLHYTLDKWKQSILEMTRITKKYIAIVRFPITKYNDTFFVHQNVRGINGIENHYFIVLNREKLEKYFNECGLEILNRDYSSEEYSISDIDEKIILVQYLLKKNN